MDVQLQIRQNALEAQQYMQDLFDWERRVKEKETGMSNGKASSDSMPAPRGRAASQVASAPQALQQPGLTANTKSSTGMKSTAKSSSTQQQQNGGGSNTAAKHTYASYSKWDKLDVDAMLEEDSDEDTTSRSKASKSSQSTQAKAAPHQHPSAPPSGFSAAAPQQTPGSNAAAKVVPAARQPPSAQIQLPRSSGSEEIDGSAPSQPHLTPISSTYTLPPGTSTSSSNSSNSSNQGAAATTQTAEPSHPPIRNSEPQTSEAWRTRGNDLFKAGQHAYAKECYSRSIALDLASATAYANRAMAELRLLEWPQAEEDCSHALRLEPNHVKALHRRGTARRQLGNTFGAAQDFEHALRMEPGNASLAKERDAAVDAHLAAAQLQMPSRRARLAVHAQAPLSPPPQQQQQQQPNATVSGRTPPAASPITKSPASPTPATKAPPPKPGLVAAAQKLDGTDGPEFPLEAVRHRVSSGQKSGPSEASQRVSGNSSVSAVPSSSSPAAPPPPPVAAAAAAAAAAAPPPVAPAAALAQSGGTTEEEKQTGSSSQVTTAETASAEQQARKSKVAAAAAAAASQLHARTLASVRSAPRTSTEFEAVWRSLKGDQGLQARYLGVIPPETLPSVFKASLTPQLLAGILRSLLGYLSTPHHTTSALSQESQVPPQNTTHPGQTNTSMANGGLQATIEGCGVGGEVLDAGHVGALLRGLSKVPRLSMAAMCMPTRERAELRGLWECTRQQADSVGALGGNGVGSTASVDNEPLSLAEWEALRAAFKL